MPTKHELYDDKDGDLWVDVFDHNEKCVSTNLGKAVYISDIYRVFETGKILLEIEYDYAGDTHNLLIPREHLKKSELLKYAANGLNINEFNAFYIIESIALQEDNHKPILTHEGVGWDNFKDEEGNVTPVFKGYQALGMKSDYRGNLPIKPQGTLKEFKKFIRAHVSRTPLSLAVALGLSSVLVGFIGNDIQGESLFVHLYGESSTGKTTAAKVAVSMGSLPSFHADYSLLNDYNGTENALLATLPGNRGFLTVFDEANSSDKKDFSLFIYRLASGRGKRRLNRDGGERKIESYLTTVLSTGEKNLTKDANQNTGKEIRVLQFGNVAWTKGAEHAEMINRFVQNNYGWPTLKLAKHLLGLGKEEVIKRYEKNRALFIENSRVADAFTGRLSAKYSFILTTAEFANECLGLDLPFETILDMLLENEVETAGNRDLGLKAYEYLMQQVNKNISKFSLAINRGEISESTANEIWGIRVPQKDPKIINGKQYSQIIYITTQKFKALLDEGKFEDISVVLKKLKQNDLLDYEQDRDTRTRKITTFGTPIKVYGLRVFEEPVDDTGEPDAPEKRPRQILNGYKRN